MVTPSSGSCPLDCSLDEMLDVVKGLPVVLYRADTPGNINIDSVFWVRESWTKVNGKVVYRADQPDRGLAWKPSVCMPKALSRFRFVVWATERVCIDDIAPEGHKKQFYAQWAKRLGCYVRHVPGKMICRIAATPELVSLEPFLM